MPNPTTAEIDAMDLQACCDYIAEAKGYSRCGAHWQEPWTNEPGRIIDHPIPPNLDAIARCLPDGWRWDHNTHYLDNQDGKWKWQAVVRRPTGHYECGEADNEILSRARAVCKAWAASKGNT